MTAPSYIKRFVEDLGAEADDVTRSEQKLLDEVKAKLDRDEDLSPKEIEQVERIWARLA